MWCCKARAPAGACALYGLERKSGWTEYSVTVDANTGEIAGCEQDWG
ncbi:MAG: hypothetical protein ACLVKK_08305 [Ruthenibacterium sp.]